MEPLQVEVEFVDNLDKAGSPALTTYTSASISTSAETPLKRAGHLAAQVRNRKSKQQGSMSTSNIEKFLGVALKEVDSLNKTKANGMEDEDLCFGHTIGLLLKKLPKKQKNLIRIKIIELFNESDKLNLINP